MISKKFLVVAAAAFVALLNNLWAQPIPQAWPDRLNMNYTPVSAKSDLGAFMSDQGAWFALALPAENRPDCLGGFSGPWLMNGQPGWISDRLLQFVMLDAATGKPAGITSSDVHSYPGRLEQNLVFGGIHTTLELVFASSNTALIRVTLINTGAEKKAFTPVWKGRVFAGTLRAGVREDGLWITNGNESRIITLRSPEETEIQVTNDTTFSLSLKAVTLLPKSFAKYFVAVSFFQSSDDAAQGLFSLNELFENPDAVFDNNQRRWKGYLANVFGRLKPAGDSAAAPGIAVKSIQTLVTNWRSKTRELEHAGIFPSAFYKDFYGFWAWDSWKQAAACAWFNPVLAKEQVRLMFSRQDSAGMVPDVVGADPSGDNFRNTKPPLAAWAVNEIYEATSDISFVKEMLPRLLLYHNWWFTHRDADSNGLCSWGSADGTPEAAKWESGMDNAVRFDHAVMVKSGVAAWCMEQESPDLNAYLYAEKNYLARLLAVAGRQEESDRMLAGAEKLKKLINDTLWDQKAGWYFDRNAGAGHLVEVAGPEGWIPMWAGVVADSVQAGKMAEVITDPARFRTLMPFPSVEARAAGFAPEKGYWRGPVWLDQAGFALAALRRYGMVSLADELQHQMLTAPNGIAGKGSPLYENYDPLTAAGLNAPHFSWSAAHLLLMLMQR